MPLDGLIFIIFFGVTLQTACSETGGFRLFPQATLLIGRIRMGVSFLTDPYLECCYEELRFVHNKTNTPEEK